MTDPLDLRELASDWQEVLDELQEIAAGGDASGADPEDLRADCAKYENLCAELGLSPCDPNTLEWHGNNIYPALIPEDGFEDYARELAEETGAIDVSAYTTWPLSCIDWECAADTLLIDYTGVQYDGYTYYTRS